MNKTAQCILLLNCLNRKNIMNTNELAELLETNPRNISEYIKELEIAGYTIESIMGKYGGYHLVKEECFPVLKFSKEEIAVLNEVTSYIDSAKDFLNKKTFFKAISKVFSAQYHNDPNSQILNFERFPLSMNFSDLEKRYMIICESINENKKLEIIYLSTKNKENTHIIHPYKTFIYNGSWFMLGYNERIKDLGYYKLNRIIDLKIKNEFFKVSALYDLKDYIDEYGMKQNGEYYEVILDFYDLYTVISERVYGKNQVIEIIDDKITRLKCKMQNKNAIINFVLGFGSKVKVISPNWLVDDVKKETINIMNNYK